MTKTIEEKILSELAMRSLSKEALLDTLKLPSKEVYDFAVALHRLIFREQVEIDPNERYVAYRLTLKQHAKRLASDRGAFGC